MKPQTLVKENPRADAEEILSIARKRVAEKAASEGAMKKRVHEEMTAVMDVGVRVNPAL